MLIGNVVLSNRGIRIVDVDGSHVEIGAEDVLNLGQWILLHKEQLHEIIRGQEKRAQEEQHR